MGKNSAALRYINASHHARVFIFDPEEEFGQRLFGDRRAMSTATTWEGIVALTENRRIIIFDPSYLFPGETADGFAWFSGQIFDLARDGLAPRGIGSLLVTDEIQKYVNHSYAPPEFKTVLETGRRQMLDTLSISRAPNRINTSVREEITELLLFRLDDSNSLKFAEGVGANVDTVQTLAEHEYLYYNVVRGREGRGKIEFQKKLESVPGLDKPSPPSP